VEQTVTQTTEKTMRTWVLALTSMASFMVALDGLVVATALNAIRGHFGVSVEALQWVVNAYNLSFAVLLLTGAALGERLGRKPMFMGGLGLFIAASAACALAPSASWLIAARILQGAGAALVMPLAMTLLSAAFPPNLRAKALGVYSSVTGLAVLGAPVIGGFITQGIAWEWIFWLNVPIGLVAIALALKYIPASHETDAKLDIPGLSLIAAAVLALVWGLVRGNAAGWDSPEVIGALTLGGLLAVGFIMIERRSVHPMLPMQFFRSRAFTAGNVAVFFLYASLYGAVFFVAQFLQIAKGYSPLSSGMHLLPWTGVLFIIAPMAGRLVNRFGERPLVGLGLLLQALGMAWIAYAASPHVAYGSLVVPFIMAGAGVSLAIPAAQHVVVAAVDHRAIGKASGTFNTFRFLGGVFGVAIMVAAFMATGNYHSGIAFSHGFSAAIWAGATLSAVGAIIAAMLPPSSRA